MAWPSLNLKQEEIVTLINLYTKFIFEYTSEFNSLPSQSKDPVNILNLFDDELPSYASMGLTPENGFSNEVAFVSFLNKYFRSI